MRKKLFMLLVFLCFVCVHPGFAQESKTKIDELFEKSGMEYQLGNFAQTAITGFDNQQKTSSVSLTPEEQVKVHQLMSEGWSVQALSPVIKEYISNHLSAEALDKSLIWLNTPLGMQITKLEQEASNPNTIDKIKEYLLKLTEQPPEPARMELIKRYVVATNGVELVYKMYLAQEESTVASLARSNSVEDQAKAKQIRFGSELARPQIKASAEQQLLITGLYTYKDLSDEQLSQYVDFLATKEGSDYMRVTQEALLESIKTVQQKIADYLLELIKSKSKS